MRKIKLRRCEYDYVEVMACPSGKHKLLPKCPLVAQHSCAACPCNRPPPHSTTPTALAGCLNGGGQVKPAPGQTAAQLIEQLEQLYAADGSAGRGRATPEADAWARQLYQGWVRGAPGSEAARQLLHTQYHKREKTVTAALADW